MNATHAVSACAVAIAAICLVTTFSPAGDLTPPSGAITETMKTLDQVEPRIPIGRYTTPGDAHAIYRITEPGSYYLTASIDLRPGYAGIEVTASDVTIDLTGYRITGEGETSTGYGVSTAFGIENLTIRNGYLTDIRAWGISGSNVTRLVLEDLTITRCVGLGVYGGDDFRASRCVSNGHSGNGFQFGNRALIIDCASLDNGGDGFKGSGRFIRCAAENNGSNGFEFTTASKFEECQAIANGDYGFDGVGIDGCFTRCIADANNWGFHASRSIFRDCIARDNTSSGFVTGDGSIVVSCMAVNNGGSGFYAGDGCLVRDCTAHQNGIHGIHVFHSTQIVGNACFDNGEDSTDGAGVYAQGAYNRIERNTVVDNDYGVRVGGSRNLVIRNMERLSQIEGFEVDTSENALGQILLYLQIETDDNPHSNYVP